MKGLLYLKEPKFNHNFYFGLGVVSRHHIPWPRTPLKKLSHYGIPAHPISQKYSLRLFTFLLLTVALRKEMEKNPKYPFWISLFTAGSCLSLSHFSLSLSLNWSDHSILPL